jgi:hypothetical protein
MFRRGERPAPPPPRLVERESQPQQLPSRRSARGTSGRRGGPGGTASRHVVAVPVDYALVFDAAHGWRYQSAPPGWWFAEQETLLEQEEERDVPVLTLVPAPQGPRTSCRPGRGPCRRQHEHVICPALFGPR